jgi:hypothetical protein
VYARFQVWVFESKTHFWSPAVVEAAAAVYCPSGPPVVAE